MTKDDYNFIESDEYNEYFHKVIEAKTEKQKVKDIIKTEVERDSVEVSIYRLYEHLLKYARWEYKQKYYEFSWVNTIIRCLKAIRYSVRDKNVYKRVQDEMNNGLKEKCFDKALKIMFDQCKLNKERHYDKIIEQINIIFPDIDSMTNVEKYEMFFKTFADNDDRLNYALLKLKFM